MARGQIDKNMANKIIITQTKSAIGSPKRVVGTLKALGIRRMHQRVEHSDSPQLRGMIDKVRHLVTVSEA